MSSPGSQDFRSRLEPHCHPTPAMLGVQLANWRYWGVSASIVVETNSLKSLSLYIYVCMCHTYTHAHPVDPSPPPPPPKTLMSKLC